MSSEFAPAGPDWSLPPPPPAGEDDLFVDVGFNLHSVSAVDTRSLSAFIRLEIRYYWTDQRLAGSDHSKMQRLPGGLWTPKLDLRNAMEAEERQNMPELINRQSGRLKRTQWYQGTIENPMDLRKFPFDVDALAIRFSTWSHWISLDGQATGFTSCEPRTYRVQKVSRRGEGGFLDMRFTGDIPEFTLLGISSIIDEKEKNELGGEVTLVDVAFHLSRKSAFYFWKCLVPLYMLTALSFTIYFLDSNNLEGRLGNTATFFLAAFALLYVVGESLPKTDFLTNVDKVIVLSTTTVVIGGLAAPLLKFIHDKHGELAANEWNLYIGTLVFVAYCLCNAILLCKPCFFNIKWSAMLSSSQVDRAKYVKLPTLEEGCEGGVKEGWDYSSLKDLQIDNEKMITQASPISKDA